VSFNRPRARPREDVVLGRVSILNDALRKHAQNHRTNLLMPFFSSTSTIHGTPHGPNHY
jgi:hypothetical protein